MPLFFERLFLIVFFKIAPGECSYRVSSLYIQMVIPGFLHSFLKPDDILLQDLCFQPFHGKLFIFQLRTGILHENTLSGRDMGGTDCRVHFIHILAAAPLASYCLEPDLFFLKTDFLQTFQLKNSDEPVAAFVQFPEGTFTCPADATQLGR